MQSLWCSDRSQSDIVSHAVNVGNPNCRSAHTPVVGFHVGGGVGVVVSVGAPPLGGPVAPTWCAGGVAWVVWYCSGVGVSGHWWAGLNL